MLEWILCRYITVQCDGKILLKERNFLSLTKFKLLFQTEGKSINICDVKIVISVWGGGGIAITCPRCRKSSYVTASHT